VSQDKIRSKGVDSVKSRIVNLAECNPAISITALIENLRVVFDEVYGIKARELSLENLFTEFPGAGKDRLTELEAQFADPAWKYGKNPPFAFETASRFAWGGVEIGLDVSQNTIREARIFSDAMDGDFIQEFAGLMKGSSFNREKLSSRIAAVYRDDPLRREYATDIITLVFEEFAGTWEPE
jgi:lipoate-protein ligase A